jgi:hypothetical protein
MKIDFSTIAYVRHSLAGPVSNLRGFAKDVNDYLSETHPAIMAEKTNPKGLFTIGHKLECLVRDADNIISEIDRIRDAATPEAYEIIRALVDELNRQIENTPTARERTAPAILDKAESFLTNWNP